MDNQEQTQFIAMMVEKVSKGVRKQLKGYVRVTIDEIQQERNLISYRIREFESLYERVHLVRKDLVAFELMIKEGEELKKIKYTLMKLIEDVNNRIADITFLKIETANEIKLLKKKREYEGGVNE